MGLRLHPGEPGAGFRLGGNLFTNFAAAEIFFTESLYLLAFHFISSRYTGCRVHSKGDNMNNILKIALIVVAVLAVAGGLFFAGQVYGSWQNGSQYGFWGTPMMGGYGMQSNQAGYSRGPMMGGGRGYGGMMGGGYSNVANVQLLTVDEAKQSAQKYVDSLGLSDLSLGEVMVFDNNAYVVVKENSTGMGAFELLVDPTT